MPRARSTLAAIAARGPLSQIVTTGRSPQSPFSAACARHPVGKVAAAGDRAVVALVRLAHVEHLDLARREPPLQLVDRHRLHELLAAAARQPARSKSPTACNARAARAASSSSRASSTTGPSGRTNAAFVPKLEPDTGTLTAPGR